MTVFLPCCTSNSPVLPARLDYFIINYQNLFNRAVQSGNATNHKTRFSYNTAIYLFIPIFIKRRHNFARTKTKPTVASVSLLRGFVWESYRVYCGTIWKERFLSNDTYIIPLVSHNSKLYVRRIISFFVEVWRVLSIVIKPRLLCILCGFAHVGIV